MIEEKNGGVVLLAKAVEQNRELAILEIVARAEVLKERAQEILKEVRSEERNGESLPLFSLRYSGRDPFPRLVWVYSFGKSGVRAGGQTRFTREFSKPKGYRYRARIFEPLPEPHRSDLMEVEREAAELRRLISRTKDVFKFAKDYGR